MKKLMDKLINKVRFDKKYVLFSIVIVILGIITGSLFIVILNGTDKLLVIEYIESFVNSLQDNSIKYIDILKNTTLINFLIIFIMSIIGFTYFLFPINILILFYKSFILGFSLASFILTYKIKGLLLSIIYIFPHLIINILVFSLLTAFTLKLSFDMIKYIIKKKEVNMRQYFSKYIYMIILFSITLTVTSLYEVFAATTILKLLVKVLI